MTSTEMIQAFKVGYDIVNLEGPGYEDEEILIFLNKSQIIEIKKEISIRRWTYISNIIENEMMSTSIPAWSNYINFRCVIPTLDDYIGYVSSKSKIVRSTFKPTGAVQWVDNILIKKEVSGKYLTNDLNRVILLNPRVFEDEDGTISIIYDSNTVYNGTDDFTLEYVHMPVKIETGVNCELNEILHERIVATAVDLAKNVFNPQEAGNSQQVDQLMVNPKQ